MFIVAFVVTAERNTAAHREAQMNGWIGIFRALSPARVMR